MCATCIPCTHRGQKKVLDILELELEVGVSHPMWVLEIKLRFYRRATSVLHPSPLQQVHCPAPKFRVKQFATSLVEEAECLSFGLVSGTEEILVCLEALSLISPTL